MTRQEFPPHARSKTKMAIISVRVSLHLDSSHLTLAHPQDISTCQKLVHAHFGATVLDSGTSLCECLVRQLRLICNSVGRSFLRFDSWSPSTLDSTSLDGDGNAHVFLMMAALYTIRCRCESGAGLHVDGDRGGSEDGLGRKIYCCYAQASLVTAEMIEV